MNRLGMADDAVELEATQPSFRIAFVGDSLTANYRHRPRNEIYLELIEDELAARSPDGLRVEALNFGANGYSVLQTVQMARTRAPRFDPDILVAQLCLNDPYASNMPPPPPALEQRQPCP